MKDEKRTSYRILGVVAGCGGGDWPPLLALMIALQQRGHKLRVVCDKGTVEAVTSSGLTAICLPDELDLENLFEAAISMLLSQKTQSFQTIHSPFKIWGEFCVDFVKKSLAAWAPSVVITSLFGISLGEILTTEYRALRCFLNPSFYFGHSLHHLRDADFSKVGGQMYKHWLLPHVKTADLVLHATDRQFDICAGELPGHHKYVGPMFWEISGNEQELLNSSGPPWVLITLSTSPQPGDMDIVRAALKPLEQMNVCVLVTLAPSHGKDELGRVPANVHVTGYLAHSKILPLCCMVISHAGHGIVMKAMMYGVPMVLVPWGRDQPGVAVRARRMGVATVVPREECGVTALTDAIRKIRTVPEYQEHSRLVSSQLKKTNGVERGVGYLEQLLRKNFSLH
ncbi:MAG: hypothetical protein GY702_12880 [Desulfobulbaceae bacterium]|nr:hypothetical protein [Desulfobulbaceae bacterium]